MNIVALMRRAGGWCRGRSRMSEERRYLTGAIARSREGEKIATELIMILAQKVNATATRCYQATSREIVAGPSISHLILDLVVTRHFHIEKAML